MPVADYPRTPTTSSAASTITSARSTQTFFRYVRLPRGRPGWRRVLLAVRPVQRRRVELRRCLPLQRRARVQPLASRRCRRSASAASISATPTPPRCSRLLRSSFSPNATDPYTNNSFQFPGFYSTNPANGGLPFGGPQNTIQYNQDVNLSKGRHQIQGAAQILYIQENSAYGAYAQAIEQLGVNKVSGLAEPADRQPLRVSAAAVNPNGATPLALATPTPGTLIQTTACTITLPATQPAFARSDRFHDWAAYAQDQWKVQPNFTITTASATSTSASSTTTTRTSTPTSTTEPAPAFLPRSAAGSVTDRSQQPHQEALEPAVRHRLPAPRLRAMTSSATARPPSAVATVSPTSATSATSPSTSSRTRPTTPSSSSSSRARPVNPVVTNSNSGPLSGSSGSVALPPTSLRHVDQNIRTAQTQFHSFSVDQQLARGTVVEISYNGARGIHLYDIKNYNIPGSGNYYLGDPIKDPITGNSALTYANPTVLQRQQPRLQRRLYYNAINVQLTTTDIHHTGLSIVANYTFGHALDDLSTTFSETSARQLRRSATPTPSTRRSITATRTSTSVTAS